ncbi:MAG: HAD family hydrolase [Candidatus Pelethousia sp.]|nr:HAD family hydrolase [Candidatus Pelethousia sp.]
MADFEAVELIMLDIDGTLVDTPRQRALPRETADVLTRVMKKDIRVGLASGRNYGHIMAHMGALGLNGPFVCSNGAYVVAGETVLYESSLGQPVRRYAYSIAEKIGCLAEFSAPSKLFVYRTPGGYAGPAFAANEDGACLIPLDGSMANFQQVLDEPVDKITFAVDTREKAARLRAALQDWNAAASEPLSITASFWFAIEVTNQGVNKGRGLQIALEKLQISPNRVMAFGDGDNDTQMLQSVGISFAMGNASRAAKAAAMYAAPSVAENGVCAVLKQYILGESR